MPLPGLDHETPARKQSSSESTKELSFQLLSGKSSLLLRDPCAFPSSRSPTGTGTDPSNAALFVFQNQEGPRACLQLVESSDNQAGASLLPSIKVCLACLPLSPG
uniref:Uncharacterized protein n=1 Tax=Micrurus corallinus TaxID=54390 RepID=A0A2D4GR25_MICCO